MLQNIFPTKIIGSNLIYLNIPEEEYKSKFSSIDIANSQNLANEYFNDGGKEVSSKVQRVDLDSYTGTVNITLELIN
ncbi:hypothetical protein [Clostridium tetani]|uniref:Uncharacterized protein n=1 Tax=Clostridium tetani TaxID=1513 RepID=A0ABY0ERA2_CLOTA|nr:hypothetical protein [Clostridium tetani]CDI50226.1 hypothetical protein BN906_02239 [Clostridium tetani 12124569]KHO38241.1 hypothetical protein OR62_10645 [Clostridium tetani]RXI40378.1 hypothetical protein DP129_04370 [Clostridium tetani]RXI53532.1 hypothetical protein DP131_11190 [Clostridium tetani]RXI66841.1 hypothetical protein DQN76_12910 [Clostridium tetani]